MGNRTPVIKKYMTGFCFVWMQGKEWRFSVSQTAVCRKSDKLENRKNYYSCSVWMIFVVQTWHLCPFISAAEGAGDTAKRQNRPLLSNIKMRQNMVRVFIFVAASMLFLFYFLFFSVKTEGGCVILHRGAE